MSRVAVVTGGNRGIGLACSRALVAAGHTVVVACRSGEAPDGLEAVAWARQVEALGVPLVEAGIRLALGQAAGIAGRILWALLADRLGALPVLGLIAAGIVVASLGLAIAGPAWSGAAIIALAIAMGATAVGWTGLLLAEVARVAPSGRVGAATSAMGFAMALTMIVSPVLVALVIRLSGSYAGAFVACAVAAMAAGGALRAARRAVRLAEIRPGGRGSQ